MRLRHWFSALGLIAVFALAPALARAQTGDELIDLVKEGQTEAASSVEAAREIQANAIAETARAQTLEILGEKRFQKGKSVIESKIVKQAAKFIPYVNSGEPKQLPDGTWKMSVSIKLSQSSLRKMILEAGLLNDADGPASIVPVIAFADRQRGVSLRWWQGEPKDDGHKFLSELSRQFHDRLQSEFSRQGFHVIKPLGTQVSPLPEGYRTEQLSASDLAFVAEFFNASMVVKGDVRFKESRQTPGVVLCSIRLQVAQPVSGRTVAEVSRQFSTEPGTYESVVRAKLQSEVPDIAKDLATQVLEAWQRGTLNTNLIRLAVKGSLTPKQLSDLKGGLVQNVREVKSIKERLFEKGEVLFEVDFVGEPGPLAERLKTLKLAGFETKLAQVSDKEIELDVKAAR